MHLPKISINAPSLDMFSGSEMDLRSGLVMGGDVTAQVHSWLNSVYNGEYTDIPEWLSDTYADIPTEMGGLVRTVNDYIHRNISMNVTLRMFDDPTKFRPRFVLTLTEISKHIPLEIFLVLRDNTHIRSEFQQAVALFGASQSEPTVVGVKIDYSEILTEPSCK